jgi:hypothetical protein
LHQRANGFCWIFFKGASSARSFSITGILVDGTAQSAMSLGNWHRKTQELRNQEPKGSGSGVRTRCYGSCVRSCSEVPCPWTREVSVPALHGEPWLPNSNDFF